MSNSPLIFPITEPEDVEDFKLKLANEYELKDNNTPAIGFGDITPASSVASYSPVGAKSTIIPENFKNTSDEASIEENSDPARDDHEMTEPHLRLSLKHLFVPIYNTSSPLTTLPTQPFLFPPDYITVNIFLPPPLLQRICLNTPYTRIQLPRYAPVSEVIRAAGGTQEFDGVQEVDFVTVKGKVEIVYGNVYRGFHKVNLEQVGWVGVVRIWRCSDQVWVRLVKGGNGVWLGGADVA
ncbi:hypothetical protein RUND412_006435 [Rhizina undulata]